MTATELENWDGRHVTKNATTLSYQNLAALFFVKHLAGRCITFLLESSILKKLICQFLPT